MKTVLIAGFVAAAAAVAGVIAYRLSADALAMIVGVILGLLALIPTLALVAIVLRRSQRETPETRAMPAYPQPPVVVVSGGYPQLPQQMQPTAYGPPQQGLIPAPQSRQPRQFRMMGYESNDAVELNDDEWSAFG